jgi:5-methylcytosine-specific restriction endonuclease McrA
MGKSKLKTLGSRLSAVPQRIPSLKISSFSTRRLRGRAGMERRAKWLAEHPLCVHCQDGDRTTAATIVDHKEPLWRGGADDESNFQSLCKTHHDAKTAKEAAERASGMY